MSHDRSGLNFFSIAGPPASQRAVRLKKIQSRLIAWNFQSIRLKCSIPRLKISSVWIESFTRSIGIEVFSIAGPSGKQGAPPQSRGQKMLPSFGTYNVYVIISGWSVNVSFVVRMVPPGGLGGNFAVQRCQRCQPWPSNPCFFRFPCFFCFPISLAFLCVFSLSFPRILGIPRREKPLLFWWVSKKQGLEGQGRNKKEKSS